MRVRIIGMLLLVGAVSTAFAAPVAYELNKDHTDVTFRISHAGFTMKHGWFTDISGTLNLDEQHLDASSVDATIAMNSISTNSDKRDGHLKNPDFFDVV